MSRRSNPWPAFVDLFSALLVAAFAGFILIASELKSTTDLRHQIRDLQVEIASLEQQLHDVRTSKGEITKVRAEADRIVRSLEAALGQDQDLGTKVSRCGDDACLDLFIHYPRNLGLIPADQELELGALHTACRRLRSALDQLPSGDPHDIEILVEGHADRTQAQVDDLQRAFLYNWSLSSLRAASVLYEFRLEDCGLTPPRYSISVIGHADSERLCEERNQACDSQNRRTTLRLRANSQHIDRRLGAAPSSTPR